MFETEAEENANQFIKTHSESDDFINCKRETDNYNVILAQGYELGFQKGAEFGFNKANEWHKADVPTSPINKIVLGYIKDCNSKSFCLVKWNGEWWYDARTWNDKVKLIAWKEIVLPELKESE